MPEFAAHPLPLRTQPYPRPVPGSPFAGHGWSKSAGIGPVCALPRSDRGRSSGGRPSLRAVPCPGPVSVRWWRDISRPAAAPRCGPPPIPMRPRFCCTQCGCCPLGQDGCRPPETTRRICGLRIQCRARSPYRTPGAEMIYFPVQAAPAYRTLRCAPHCWVRCRPCRGPDQ